MSAKKTVTWHAFNDVANATLERLTCQQNDKKIAKRQKCLGTKIRVKIAIFFLLLLP
jgi:hypothetical protein